MGCRNLFAAPPSVLLLLSTHHSTKSRCAVSFSVSEAPRFAEAARMRAVCRKPREDMEKPLSPVWVSVPLNMRARAHLYSCSFRSL